jgi:TPR repeat protein
MLTSRLIALSHIFLAVLLIIPLATFADESEAIRAFNKALVEQQNGNYKKAKVLYLESAKQGLAEAQYNLASMYYTGNGIEVNNSQAIYWFRKAGKQGFAEAQYNLGIINSDQGGEKVNLTEAIYWFRKAARQGYIEAFSGLGNLIASHRGGRDYKKGIEWLEKGFSSGDRSTESILRLMDTLNLAFLLYDTGYNVERDISQAAIYLRKFKQYIYFLPTEEKEHHHYLARKMEQQLGKTINLSSGKRCDITIQGFSDVNEKNMAQFFIKTLNQFRPFENKNLCFDINPQKNLFYNCENDAGCDVRYNHIVNDIKGDILIFIQEHYNQTNSMASANEDEASLFLAKIVTPQSMHHELMHLFEFSDEYQNDEVCKDEYKEESANLFVIKYDDRNDAEHRNKLSKYRYETDTCKGSDDYLSYKKLPGLNLMDSGLNMPDLYNDYVVNLLESEHYFSHKFTNEIGKIYLNDNDVHSAVQWYELGAKNKNVTSLDVLGKLYYDGERVEQDLNKAEEYLLLAVNQGTKKHRQDLFYALAMNYYRGTDKVTKNHVRAAHWFRKAAELGHSSSQVGLAFMLQKGYGVEKNETKSVYWNRKAAENGSSIGKRRLGDMYLYGKGIEQDISQAIFWYKKSAENNNAKAQNRLGQLYKDGVGVERNKDTAIYWFRKAVKNGDAHAQKDLDKLMGTANN